MRRSTRSSRPRPAHGHDPLAPQVLQRVQRAQPPEQFGVIVDLGTLAAPRFVAPARASAEQCNARDARISQGLVDDALADQLDDAGARDLGVDEDLAVGLARAAEGRGVVDPPSPARGESTISIPESSIRRRAASMTSAARGPLAPQRAEARSTRRKPVIFPGDRPVINRSPPPWGCKE